MCLICVNDFVTDFIYLLAKMRVLVGNRMNQVSVVISVVIATFGSTVQTRGRRC